jgi:hypothetical protein
MDVLIVTGDQDTYHEAEADVASSPIWLADVLAAEGLTGLFVLHARRAEILAEQGRRDVIQALRRHEIDLHGRVALVSGARQNIGRAIALGLVEAGADLLICDLRTDTLEQTTDEIARLGRWVMPITCDLFARQPRERVGGTRR